MQCLHFGGRVFDEPKNGHYRWSLSLGRREGKFIQRLEFVRRKGLCEVRIRMSVIPLGYSNELDCAIVHSTKIGSSPF